MFKCMSKDLWKLNSCFILPSVSGFKKLKPAQYYKKKNNTILIRVIFLAASDMHWDLIRRQVRGIIGACFISYHILKGAAFF